MAVMACTAQTCLGAGMINAALGTIAVPVGREIRDLCLSSLEVAPGRGREQLWWKSACAGATMTAEERAPWCKSKSTCDGGREVARVMALQSRRRRRRQWRKSAHDEGRSVDKIPTVAAAAAPLCAGSSPRSGSPLPPHRSLDSIARRDSHVYVASPRSRPKGMPSSSSFRVQLFIAPSAHATPIPTVRSSTWRSFNERGKWRQLRKGKGKGKGRGGSPPSPPTCALGWDSILLAGFSLMIEGKRRRRAPLLLSSSTVSDDINKARDVESHANATSSSSSSSSSSSLPGNQSNADVFQEQQEKTYDRTKGKEEEEEKEEEGEEEESPSLFSSISSSSSSSTFSSTTDVNLIKSGLSPNPVPDSRLNRVISTLLKDFPDVYVRELDWSVYSSDVIFVDPVVSLKGLLQHQGMYIVLRAMAWAWFEPGTAGFEIDEIKEVDPEAKTQSPFSHREYTDTLDPKRAIGMKWRTGGKTRWGTIADFSGDDVFRVGANGLIISHESSWNEDPAVVWREVFLGEERRR